MRIVRFLFALILAGGLLRAGADAPTPLLASHREMPAGWQATEIAGGLTAGPDGRLYFVTGSPRTTPRYGRFDPKTQRFEELLNLGEVLTRIEDARTVSVPAPLVFDGRGRVWLGATATSAATGKPFGALLCLTADGKTCREVTEIPDQPILDLGADRRRNTLYVLRLEQGHGSFTRYDLDRRRWEEYTGTPLSPKARLVVLPSGDAVVVCPDAVYRYQRTANALQRVAAIPDALPLGDGLAALTVGKDGRIYGITQRTPQLFAIDPRDGVVTALGPAFGDAAVPGEAAESEGRMALCAGADGRLYYAGHAQNQGLVAAYDPRTDTRAPVGVLSSPAQPMAPPMAGSACLAKDGRLYLGGYGWAGCGVYAIPTLPEPIPWSTNNRTYRCRHLDDAGITLDGDLSDPAWQAIPPMTDFVTAGPKPQPARAATVARVAWSDTHLYFGYHCATTGFKTAGAARDDGIWEAECAELFVCPRGADAPYYEIDANPDGVIYDSHIGTYTYIVMEKMYQIWAKSWNGMEVKTRVERDAQGTVTGWTMEARVPFASLDAPAPRAGSVWLFLPIRIAMTPDGQGEYTSWQPTYADFHKPHQFPKVKFVR